MGSKAIKMKDISGNIFYPCPYYPVGSIYMSVNNIDPSTFFGGKWEQIKDRFLLACGSTYSNGSTGGSTTHTHTTGDCTLTVNQMPSHSHTTATVYPFTLGGMRTAIANSNSSDRTGTAYDVVDSTGGGQAHNHGNTGSSNNMPPYLAVYVWKRTA